MTVCVACVLSGVAYVCSACMCVMIMSVCVCDVCVCVLADLGDMVFDSHILGLGGNFGRASKNCICCEVGHDELFKKTPSQRRTLSRLYMMAHLCGPGVNFPFTCPGCEVTFESQADIDAEEAPGDKAAYEVQHASSGWHRKPLLDIEPNRVILCTLHLVLSLTKLLFKKRILWMLHTNDQANRLNKLLSQLGICIPKQRKVGDSLSHDQTGRIRFTGPDCFALMRNFNAVVAEVLIGAPSPDAMAIWARET